MSYFASVLTSPQEQWEATSPSLWKLNPEACCADTLQLVRCWTSAPAPYSPKPRVSGNTACVGGWTFSIGLHLHYYQRKGLLLRAVESQKIMRCKARVFMSRTDPCLIVRPREMRAPALLSAGIFLPKETSSLVFPKSFPSVTKLHMGPCEFVLSLQKLVAL